MSFYVEVKATLGALSLDVDLRGGVGPHAIVGPNGSGKTTLLRMIAGAARPATGTIKVGAETFFDETRDVPPERRGVGYVPQGHGLFDHMRVLDNVAFGLSTGPRKRPRADRRRAALAQLTALGCAHLEDRRPAALSGGERQRVALARALVIDPSILLLDEPLAALDAIARRQVRASLAAHLAAFGKPSILVTHDVRDVVALDAHVFVIENGVMVQQGSVDQLRDAPATAFVEEFVAV